MRAISTATMAPPTSQTEALWIYNGLDCCVTREVYDVTSVQLTNTTAATYSLSRSLQAPCMSMALTGVRIDRSARNAVVSDYEKTLTTLETDFNRILSEGLGITLNWRSLIDLRNLFYDVMQIPPVTHMGKVTVDRNALEKLTKYFYAKPLINYILSMRDLGKKISTLKTEIDRDGRMRTQYNIAGTTTGRLSSSFSILGTGGNFQNWEEKLRRIFVADPGMKFAYIDLEQAESRLVGAIEWNLFGDGAYLDACESGDLHTAVAKLAWPDLAWPGDPLGDKKLAESPFYRQHSYRHMAKVLGHGTNYNGQPWTMAQHTKIPQEVIAKFQESYFRAFPAHQRWHQTVARTLRDDGFLINLMGRKRWFWGRRDDPSTIREAIAFDPQGSVGDIMNLGMLAVWRLGISQLLMQVHDAILVQYPEADEDRTLAEVMRSIVVPVELKNGRTLCIPAEAKVGWNWANQSEANPDGLRKYIPADPRTRSSFPADNIMDQRIHSLD